MLDASYIKSSEAEKDLRLCISIYMRCTHACYINYMEGMIAVLEQWGPKEEDIQAFPKYPVEPFPDVCTCGNKLNLTGSIVRNHCFKCKGNISTYQYAMYRITSRFNIPQYYMESLFAKVIYYGY